jgi:hypothetical protein
MKLPKILLTVRWLMGGVAIVGIALGIMVERQCRFHRMREYHYPRMSTIRCNGKWYDAFGYQILNWSLYKPELNYHVKMYWKYEYASRYPWLPVTPDSPSPTPSPRGDRNQEVVRDFPLLR